MRKLWILLKWTFTITGSMKFPPGDETNTLMLFHTLKRPTTPYTCTVCGVTYYSWRKKPWPICPTWQCFRDYHLGEEKNYIVNNPERWKELKHGEYLMKEANHECTRDS